MPCMTYEPHPSFVASFIEIQHFECSYALEIRNRIICGPQMLVSLIITFHMYSWIGHLS